MLYRVNLGIEDPALSKALDALAIKHQLTPFVKLAIEFYLESSEGKRIHKSLAGNATGPRKSRKKSVVAVSPVRASESKPAPAEPIHQVQHVKEGITQEETQVKAPRFTSTANIAGILAASISRQQESDT